MKRLFLNDHLEGVALGHMNSHVNYVANFYPQSSGAVGPSTMNLHPENSPQINDNEGTQFDGVVIPSDIKDGKVEAQDAPLVDLSGELDLSTLQALVNVGGELAKLVPGRVSTEVDARLAYDTHSIVRKVSSSLLQETGSTGNSKIGTILGWGMAAIYMGGRLPQICLNIRRGNVEMVLKKVDLLKNEIPFEEESVVYLKMSGLV